MAEQVVIQVHEIPVDQLLVSPSETRKTVDQAALQELASSIALKGVQEALIVRIWSEPHAGRSARQEEYEIICGQRRYAASKLAGKETCPCIVRSMSDAEASDLRIISNLQREGLPPLEEAMAFNALMDAPGATVESVAAKLGKSPSFVGRRLKLLDAIEPVREALKAGAIEVGHAMELARLSAQQQANLLSKLDVGYFALEDADEDAACEIDYRGICKFCGCSNDNPCCLSGGVNCTWANEEQTVCSDPDCLEQVKFGRWRPTRSSVANLRVEISRSMLRVLSDAPFPLDDDLPPMACVECPKRSGNAALLFEDCAQDTCTDRECYEKKVKVWIKSELQSADDEKRNLVMVSDGWTENHAAVIKYEVHILKDAPCACAEDAIWINGEWAGWRFQICRDLKCATHGRDGVRCLVERKDPVKAKAERKKLLAKVKVEKEYRLQLFRELLNKPIDPIPTDEMVRALVIFAIGRFDSTKHDELSKTLAWPKEFFDWRRRSNGKGALERLMEYSQAELLRIALVGLEANELTVHEYDIDCSRNDGKKPEIGLESVAKLIGVDAAVIRERVDPSAKSPAKPPVKKKSPAKPPVKKKSPAKPPVKKKSPAKPPVKKAAPKKAATSKKPAVKKRGAR